MNKNIFSLRNALILGMVILAAGARFIPHPANFTPIMAMALFAGAYFSRKSIAIVLPLSILLISDLIIGLHAAMWGVHLAFALSIGIGFLLRGRVKVVSVLGASLFSAIVFFLVSNFAVWIGGYCGYPMTGSGLFLCYEMALPFFRNEILSSLVYSAVMFGVFEWANRKIAAKA